MVVVISGALYPWRLKKLGMPAGIPLLHCWAAPWVWPLMRHAGAPLQGGQGHPGGLVEAASCRAKQVWVFRLLAPDH